MTTLALAARSSRSRSLGIVAVVGALALASQFAVPLPNTPVPLTLQPFVVVLSGLLLGPLDAAAAMVVYLVIGAAGLPVFAPIGPPGLARLLSATGGYLLAYPLSAAVSGWLGAGREKFTTRALAACAGMLALYAGGLAQLFVITGSVATAALLGVVPFALQHRPDEGVEDLLQGQLPQPHLRGGSRDRAPSRLAFLTTEQSATPARQLAGAIARAIGFVVILVVLQVSIVTVLGTVLPLQQSTRAAQLQVDSVLQLLAGLGATAIMLRSIDVRPWADVGLARRAARPRPIIEGWCLGGGAIGFACGLLIALGWLRVVPAPAGSSLATGASLTLLLVIAALGEEVISRGYLFTALRDGLGDWGAIATTSLLFGAAHLFNAGVTAESFAVVTLAGIFLAAVRVVFRSIYASWAAHVAWNWTLAVAFHASVSGIEFDAPDYRTVSSGPAWITGGVWGPEGGIAAALGMLIALAYLYRTRRRREEP